MDICLTTLNATYQHASLGLRYLMANLGVLKEQCVLREFTLAHDLKEVAWEIKKQNPKIIGLGVYIWNIDQSLELISLLRKLLPKTKIVAGGPELSFDKIPHPLIDCIIAGEADLAFREVAQSILAGREIPKIMRAPRPDLNQLALPYDLYSEEDLRNRFTYVEASRGCAYRCEFCLSSLDEKVRLFPKTFFESLESLYQRGARHFKFVDRTFNLQPKLSLAILQFFFERLTPDLFLHFEMIPDRFPEELKAMVIQFPPGILQFEVGIQTWNPQVAAKIARQQNYVLVENNLRFLRDQTHVHIHADLIVGLAGETFESFGDGFNALYQLRPHEIQVGLLKRLKGTPLTARDHENIYEDSPPYRILRTPTMSFEEIQELNRFAKFWDLIGNSGNFKNTLHLASNQWLNFFEGFFEMSRFLFKRHPQPWGVALLNLTESVWTYLSNQLAESPINQEALRVAITHDYSLQGKRHIPQFLSPSLPELPKSTRRARRQERHLDSRTLL